MKNTTKSALLLAAALVLPVAKASAAEQPGWYGTLGAGMAFQNDTEHTSANTNNFKFTNPGFDVLGSVGYAYGNGLRFEGEAFHGYSTVRDADGAISNTDLFLNGLYDFDLGTFFTPYVGAGVGVGFVGAENIGRTTGTTHIDGNDTQFAYQGIAGVSMPINNEWSVSADYRYIATLDPKFGNSAGGNNEIDNASHNVLFSVRYNFDAPTPAPVKAAPAPRTQVKAAVKPHVAEVAQTYQVFFDFDKATLTDEAKKIIAAAAEDYKSGKYVRIAVTGHTDTKGKDKYNVGLSNRRAAAVKAEFAKLGVDAKGIVTHGVGKKGLLVPTNDQVREAQNRRAEIVFESK